MSLQNQEEVERGVSYTTSFWKIGSNERGDWMLVGDESVKLEKQLVEIQNSRKITDQYEGIHAIYPIQ